MDEIKLKPCPFCGGEACYETPMHILTEGIMVIECKNCGACPYVVPVKSGKDETEKKNEIAEKWNRRYGMIRSNDTVFHRPSGETWVVCGVDNEKGELIPCGYPFPTLAKLSDCELIEAGDGKQPKEYADALKKECLDRFIEGMSDNDPNNSSCR